MEMLSCWSEKKKLICISFLFRYLIVEYKGNRHHRFYSFFYYIEFRSAYPYCLNERTKFMNKDRGIPIRNLLPSLPLYGERFVDTRTRSKITNHNLSSDIEIFFIFLKNFS